MMDYLYGIQTRRKKMTIDKIQEYIALYAPTVFMVISVIMNYLKTFKELKKNVSNIENSEVLKNTKTEIAELKEQLARQAKENLELKVLQMELINELKKVEKYDTNKEIQES